MGFEDFLSALPVQYRIEGRDIWGRLLGRADVWVSAYYAVTHAEREARLRWPDAHRVYVWPVEYEDDDW